MKIKKTIEQSQKTIGASVASSILAAAIMTASSVASAGDSERCADIIKGGKNSCAVKALGVSCQGHIEEDNVAGAWIKVPAGTCSNIVDICAGTADAPEGVSAKKIAKVCKKIAPQEEGVSGGRLVDKQGETIELMEKEAEVMEKEAELVEKEAELAQKKDEVMAKEVEIMEKKAEVMKKEAEVMEKKAEVMEKAAEVIEDKADMIKQTVKEAVLQEG